MPRARLPRRSHACCHIDAPDSPARVRVHLLAQQRSGRAERQQAQHQGAAPLARLGQPEPARGGSSPPAGNSPAPHHVAGGSADIQPAFSRRRPQHGGLSRKASKHLARSVEAAPSPQTHSSNSRVDSPSARKQASRFEKEAQPTRRRHSRLIGPTDADRFVLL